jgi:hypothetical protein
LIPTTATAHTRNVKNAGWYNSCARQPALRKPKGFPSSALAVSPNKSPETAPKNSRVPSLHGGQLLALGALGLVCPREWGVNERHHVQPQLSNHSEEVYAQEIANTGAD